jgi:hypothetical protein
MCRKLSDHRLGLAGPDLITVATPLMRLRLSRLQKSKTGVVVKIGSGHAIPRDEG